MCILVRLRGRRQERSETAKRTELASHHTFQICAHLRIVRHEVGSCSPSAALAIVFSCRTAILLSVAIRFLIMALVVANMLIER